MCEIWLENSSFSDMCRRRCMFFPGTRFQNLFDLCECEVALFLAIVKVGRNAHTGLGPVVDEDVLPKEFAANFVRVRARDRNGSRPLRGIVRSVDPPAARFGAFDQTRRHSN